MWCLNVRQDPLAIMSIKRNLAHEINNSDDNDEKSNAHKRQKIILFTSSFFRVNI